jgi:hypothetical protein
MGDKTMKIILSSILLGVVVLMGMPISQHAIEALNKVYGPEEYHGQKIIPYKVFGPEVYHGQKLHDFNLNN